VRFIVVSPTASGIDQVEIDQTLGADERTDLLLWGSSMARNLPEIRGVSDLHDLNVEPGEIRWIVVQFSPDHLTVFHRTETVDFNTILAGEVILELKQGQVHLKSGDFILVNGVDHAWRTAKRGATLSCVVTGVKPQLS
jgi:quercetin dioxygenase-like cupin family protein